MNTPLAIAVACVLVAGCGGGGGSDAPPPPPPPAASYDLVFDSEAADGSRSLFRAVPDGTTVLALAHGKDAVRPQPRADGQALLFTSASTQPDAIPGLMLIDGLNEPAVAVSDRPEVIEREAMFSPDGKSIVFVSQRDEPGGADIFVATLTGRRLTEVRNLTPGGRTGFLPALDVTPAWSPDGSQIAFASNRSGGDFTLWVMNADGSAAREITPPGEHADVFPSWSPDASLLAFQRRGATTMRVGIVRPDGGAPAFFEFEGRAYSPAWSPDGEHIAFAADVDGEVDIHVRAASGIGEVTRITHAGADRNPAWMRRISP